MQASQEVPRPATHAAAWRGPQQDDLTWSSAVVPQSLGDEAPGVFTITDRKVHKYIYRRLASIKTKLLGEPCP